MLTIAFGIILAIVILAFLPQLLVIAASLIIGAFFIMLMILAWHDPMLYPFPIIRFAFGTALAQSLYYQYAF